MLAILLSVASIMLALLAVVQLKLTQKENRVRLEQFMGAVQAELDELAAQAGADQLTRPTTSSGPSEPTGPLAYDLDLSKVRLTQLDFFATERFDAAYFQGLAQECERPLAQEEADSLEAELEGETGQEYIFTYTGESQAPESYSVTVIPNVHGYATLDAFKGDFDLCSAGGEAYPVALNDDWLMFTSSCGTGFSDGSGLSIGCEEAKASLGESVRLR